MAGFKLTPLRHFAAVASFSGIGAAARSLHISQPALTRSIQRLEQEVGGQLFQRAARSVSLTARGEALLPHVKAILAEADLVQDYLNGPQGPHRTQVRLGTSPNFTRHVCPEIVTDFIREYPDANVVTVADKAERLISMVSNSELDLAIAMTWGTTLQMALAKNTELTHERIAGLTAAVFAPTGHALAGRKTVELEDVSTERWAVPHGLSMSYVFQDIFSSKNLSPPPQIINSSIVEHLIDMASRLGLLVILPRHIARESVQRGMLVSIDCQALQIEYEVQLITRRRGTRSNGLQLFRRLARAHFAEADL